MNYIYNIKVNLKNKLYNFYEWDKNDAVITLDRVEVFLVNENTYEDIINMKVKVDKEFLNKIKRFKNACIFCNDIDCVCTKFNNDGIIELISKLNLEEESEILDEINLKNKLELKYEKINGNNNYSFKTRNQEKIVSELKEYITKMKDDNELIDYLYQEWFNNSRCKNKYEKLLSVIDSEYSNKHEELYNVIKLLNCKNA